MTEPTKFETWAIVEIFGHQKYAGWLTTQEIGGSSLIRLDVPASDDHPAFTKLWGNGAIYSITPVAEDVARAYARSLRQSPVNAYELPEDVQRALRMVRAEAKRPMLELTDEEEEDEWEDDRDVQDVRIDGLDTGF